MTTLKLNKTASQDAPGQERTPVRPPDPKRRDRRQVPDKYRNALGAADLQQTEQSAPKERSQTSTEHNQRSQTPKATSSKPNTESRSAPAKRSSPSRTSSQRSDEPHYRQAPKRHGKLRDQKETSVAPLQARQSPQTSSDDAAFPRLSKRMAEMGLCSRREAEEWILNGWVKVNDEIIDTLGTRVSRDDNIVVSGYAKEHQAERVTILLHKPVGYVSGQAEDGYQPASVLITPENHWSEDPSQKAFKRGFLKGLAPAGRLDIDSTGLLVLTQDGRVARHLIGDDSSVEKEYLVRVEGELSDAGLKQLNEGLSLDGVKLKPAKVSWQNEDQLRFVLREGRKRQIRRMCELVGLTVVGLKRIRIGSIALGKLPPGQWRYLAPYERF